MLLKIIAIVSKWLFHRDFEKNLLKINEESIYIQVLIKII